MGSEPTIDFHGVYAALTTPASIMVSQPMSAVLLIAEPGMTDDPPVRALVERLSRTHTVETCLPCEAQACAERIQPVLTLRIDAPPGQPAEHAGPQDPKHAPAHHAPETTQHKTTDQDASAAILNALGLAACMVSPEGVVVSSSRALTALEPGLRARVIDVARRAACEPGRLPLSVDVHSPDESRCLEVSIHPAVQPAEPAAAGPGPGQPGTGAGWAVALVALIAHDVTALRRTQSKLAAIDRAGDELVRLDRELVKKMHAADRLRVLEQKIVRYAHDLLHFDHFAIRLTDDRSGKLDLIMCQGLPPAAMEVQLYAQPSGNGISGYVAATGRSYVCHDTSKDPRYVIGIDLARSSLTIPLRLSDRVIGVFNVESTRPNNFTEEDRQFGEKFATYVALALHILDLLVVERCATGQAVSGNVEGELSEPLDDIAQMAARLKLALTAAGPATDPATLRAIDRIALDVDSIRRRVKDVAAGPATIFGADRLLAESAIDPVIAGKRVLVADDDPRIRQVIRDVLRARGADVVICEDGSTAVAALSGTGGAGGPAVSSGAPGQERPLEPLVSLPRPFDMLISDIRLPDKSGYEVFSAARQANADLPVILMTGFGYDPHHSIVRASQEGLSCVLFKPFQAERLIEEVHKALGAAQG
ncbi:MAG: hypothetical protein C0475_03375 [Planctomyces sp.]|nr:hypothetical protein [Planctomyces sp.]